MYMYYAAVHGVVGESTPISNLPLVSPAGSGIGLTKFKSGNLPARIRLVESDLTTPLQIALGLNSILPAEQQKF